MSSRKINSVIDFNELDKEQIQSVLQTAHLISASKLRGNGSGKTGAFLFFEPSTRTRMSFQMAAQKLGVGTLLLEGKQGTSLEKGETIEDTIYNVAAMNPDFLVIRAGSDLDLKKVADQVPLPILNAGWGQSSHPTQALLDVMTIEQRLGSIKGKKILIIGDIRHSRVASSHLQLAKILNYDVAICGPEEFVKGVSAPVFENIEEGLQWADVAMSLRVQLERHKMQPSMDGYPEKYALTVERAKLLASEAIILHPGPVNFGVELDREVLQDPRCVILLQVSNGVHIRQSLIYHILELRN